MNHLSNLNPPQLEAVTHFEGPILILAGAGSGKTRVLTRRIANLVIHHGVRPYQILAVTFTNKATEEMRERLRGLLGEQARDLWVATFHSAALRLLRRNANLLGYTNDFVVYDEDDCRQLIKGLLKELSIDEKKFPPSLFSKAIDKAKNNLQGPQDIRPSFKGSPYEASLIADVYDKYQKRLMQANAMDFGDLLMNAVTILKKNQDVLEFYRRLLRFILVDEFQDTNGVQYEFVRLLASPRNNLLVVGDDDQSIYAFRGANLSNILEFERDFSGCKTVRLEQNYRSSENILKAAHSVIVKNTVRKAKKLWTSEAAGEPIQGFVGDDEEDEAQFVARQIAAQLQMGVQLKDIAIFYRTNAQSRALEDALMSAGIPYRIFGGLKFYERKEIKDILAYLRLVLNPNDNQAFLRIVNTPPRGIGAQAVQNIVNLGHPAHFRGAEELASANKHVEKFVTLMKSLQTRAQTLPLSLLIEAIIDETEYASKLKALKDPTAESRLENLQELQALGRAAEGQSETKTGDLALFLDKVALSAGNDLPVEENHDRDKDTKPEVVSLMTLHLAKGLEFPVVFLTGLEEGLLPHSRSIDEGNVEEERRLCYVGITRAMKKLFMTRSVMRGMFFSGSPGQSGWRLASRFIGDMPPEVFSADSQLFLDRSAKLNPYGMERGDNEYRRDSAYGRSSDGAQYRGDSRSSKRPDEHASKIAALKYIEEMRESEEVSLPGLDNIKALKKKVPKSPAGKSLPLKSADSLLNSSVTGAQPASLEDMNPGARVLHPAFGAGIVQGVEGDPVEDLKSVKVSVKFDTLDNPKLLLFKYAKLSLLN